VTLRQSSSSVSMTSELSYPFPKQLKHNKHKTTKVCKKEKKKEPARLPLRPNRIDILREKQKFERDGMTEIDGEGLILNF